MHLQEKAAVDIVPCSSMLDMWLSMIREVVVRIMYYQAEAGSLRRWRSDLECIILVACVLPNPIQYFHPPAQGFE